MNNQDTLTQTPKRPTLCYFLVCPADGLTFFRKKVSRAAFRKKTFTKNKTSLKI